MGSLDKIFYYENKSHVYSIIRNVSHILNVRSPLSINEFLKEKKHYSIYFGLPNFIHLSMNSSFDRLLLCDVIKKAIESFEPRLSFIEVEFDKYNHLIKEANIILKAYYNEDDIVLNLILNVALWEFKIDDH